MPVDVVGRPSSGEGRIPGLESAIVAACGGCAGPLAAGSRSAPADSPIFRLRKDISVWKIGCYSGRPGEDYLRRRGNNWALSAFLFR